MSSIATACVAALAAGGCSANSAVFDGPNDGGWFAKPFNVFGQAGLGDSRNDNSVISADRSGRARRPGQRRRTLRTAVGRRAAGARARFRSAAGARRPPGRLVAGDLAGAPMPAAARRRSPALQRPRAGHAALRVSGGIALGMTECQAVRRAGAPEQRRHQRRRQRRAQSRADLSERAWPGIYHFHAGRLKVVERAPEPAEAGQSRRQRRNPRKAEDRQPRRRTRRACTSRSGRLQRRAGGEPFLFRLGERGDDVGARLRQFGGARRIAREQVAVGKRRVELAELARELRDRDLGLRNPLAQRRRLDALVGRGAARLHRIGRAGDFAPTVMPWLSPDSTLRR